MTKYIKISVLARETAKKVCRGREQWIRYLDVASRLYKYPFEDQLLIYAQMCPMFIRQDGLAKIRLSGI